LKKLFLKKILSSHFIKFSLIPILVVEITLIILYFSINKYIATKNTDLMLNEAITSSQNILKNEANKISEKLRQVSEYATILQKEHESIFKNSENIYLPNGKPTFDVASNGVYYKTNKVGASLYYSSNTKITEVEAHKALFTEAMDTSLKNIVDTNPLIMASYFNSWDDLNRLYPFIPKVYEQYGEHINMEDYNFYYLADQKHNPSRKPVWTSAYLDPAGNGWMLSCIVPIYKNDFLEGVTGLDITIDSFVKNILDAKLPYDANLFMVDNEGMIIAMPNEIEKLLGLKELKDHLYTDVLLNTIEKPEEYNILKNKSPFAEHFKNLINTNSTEELIIADKKYLTLMENVGETNWKMMILVDEDKLFSSIESLRDLTNKIGYLAIGLLILFYVIFFYILLRRINKFSNDITQPIEFLSDQTTQLTKNDIEFKSVNTNVLEISQLSDNFEYMIKELKQKAHKLNKAKIIAENANKSKDEFLANISHELKTPLNSINVISEIMTTNKQKNLTEKDIKNLDVINKSGKNLLVLINDILDYSKLNVGKINLDIREFKVNDFIKNIVNSFESQFRAKNINFELNIDSSLESIITDEKRVAQIINNLLSNACKFTSENKNVSLSLIDQNEYVKIKVQDEGIGIPSDKLKLIFDRFSQVDSTTTRKFTGTGLGLTICKELVKLLKGEIKVESQEGKGSIFEVTLPKIIKGFEEVDSQDTTLKNRQKTKQNIIFLNPNPINYITKVVELKKRYEIKQVFKKIELINALQENQYDKVLVDEDSLSKEELEELKKLISDKLIYIQHLEDL
jgi:signal transduction histidine kinase